MAGQDEGFVGFDNTAQFDHPVLRRPEKAVAPAERGAVRHPAALGRSRHRLAIRQGLPEIKPPLLVPQPRQRRAGQGVEALAAALAPVAAQSSRRAPGNRSLRPAVGAHTILLHPQFNRPNRGPANLFAHQNLNGLRLLRFR